MIRGTTPKLDFMLPFETDMIEECWITLTQNKEIKVDKDLSDCECEGRKISVTLSQEDTLELDAETNVEIQLRVRTVTGDALASEIYCVRVNRILKDGEI